ncbi:MAG: hypothetical protein SVY53_08935, partial [Chloroflexota bacterium]|nr:hypothetical protein [Chloroflexota bacterium]
MKVDKLEELINMQLPPSSEDRLDQLPKRKWSPTLFWQATKRLRKDTGMTPYFYRSPAGLPRI